MEASSRCASGDRGVSSRCTYIIRGKSRGRSHYPAPKRRWNGRVQLQTYLENNLSRIDYPRYRELGLPIGSGQVEAQCKTLVGARCKQAGMRNWTYAGAEGVLRMRAAKHDGSFDALWADELRLAA